MVTAALVTLIRSFTLPGESVLDPFAGSGSSCAAALPTGRKYIGMEMDEKLNFQKLLGSFGAFSRASWRASGMRFRPFKRRARSSPHLYVPESQFFRIN